MHLLLLAALTLASSAPVVAADPATAQGKPAAAPAEQGKKVCTRESVVGSNRQKRVCRIVPSDEAPVPAEPKAEAPRVD